MSNVDLIIEERPADIGNFMVGRLLPFVQKRTIGPFVFIDHMGPRQLQPGEGLDVGPHPHIGLYILEGNVLEGDNTYGERQILIAKNAQLCEFDMEPNTTVYIFGGEALPEKRYLYWNFVSSSRERIEEVKQAWLNQEMGQVAGETEFVPLPPQPKNIRLKE